MLAIVRQPNADITPEQVLAHARGRIPRFAQPRFLDFRTSLPKTGSEKVRKVELRQSGVSAQTIDLESCETKPLAGDAQ